MTEQDALFVTTLFFRIADRIEKSNQKALQKELENLTMAEAKTLYVIGDTTPKNMKQIADDLGVAVSTPTATVDRLVEKGLVSRYPGITDRRQVLVELTKDGKILLYSMNQNALESTKKFLEHLSQKEIETLKNILIKIEERL